MKTIYFAAGCFWGAEYHFQKIKGVLNTRVGFMGGNHYNPNYDRSYDHSEVVEISYDENIVSYEELIDMFWKIHDPTSDEVTESEQRIKENKKRKLDKELIDESLRYKSIIFYDTDEDKNIIENAIIELNEMKIFVRPVATSVMKVKEFYPASAYHQKYFERLYIKKRKRHIIFRVTIILITFLLITIMKLYLS